MIKIKKRINILFAFIALPLLCGNSLFAASSAKQLEKGKELFDQKRDEEATDYFIDVMLHGNREESQEAGYYVNLIHNRMGGIQTPVEVDVNFKEGEVKRLQEGEDPSAAYGQTAYTQEDEDIAETVAEEDNDKQAQEDLDALAAQQAEEDSAAEEEQTEEDDSEEYDESSADENDDDASSDETAGDEDSSDEYTDGYDDARAAAGASSSSFDDLTSDSALQARAVYTQQKLQSMTDAAIAKIRDTKGVRIYFRNGRPDAIDMDGDVVFEGNKFKTSALPLLDEIYSLMALTPDASYVILPPGSYTDDVSLPGIRQAMALNSFFVHKGISSGKISYNMGLYDQEPPAKFANLEGLSIVFDYEAELPAQISQATSVSKTPLLSIAVTPVSNKIDMAAGEAFAVDFSVIETVNPIDNWVFQIVQHASDGKYYVVRQLEGFAPVYHQILWNGRKGIIGPELQSGKYTLVLTATDVKGEKRTLRRAVEVTGTSVKEAQAQQSAAAGEELCPKCNYKSARLWKKPGRTVKAVAPAATEAQQPAPAAPAQQPDFVDPFEDMPDTVGDYPAADSLGDASQTGVYPSTGYADNNPYDIPYTENPL